MEYTYTYGSRGRLYLNVTNRCTNRCSFCIRYRTLGLGGTVLWGEPEPDFEMLRHAIQAHGRSEDFSEFIWCGYGEPTFRLDLIVESAPWLRSRSAKIRLNTNGHANLIHGRNVLPELSEAVDEVSVSLNAPDCRRYLEICRPDLDSIHDPDGQPIALERFWKSMIDFLSLAPAYIKSVQASVVGFALTSEEVERCRVLVRSLGIEKFRVR